jgi:hypothetical protein
MEYAFSIHSNLDSLAEIPIWYLNTIDLLLLNLLV